MSEDILDEQLSEAELDGLRVLNGLNMDVHLLAIRAVREIVRLRAALADHASLLAEGAESVRHPEERCPDCDCTYATDEQRERPELEYPLLCRRKLEGDVCTNPPMEWRSRALKFESALALAVRYATKYRAERQALTEEIRVIDLAIRPLDRQPPLTRAEFLAAVVQEVQAHRKPRPPSKRRGRRR